MSATLRPPEPKDYEAVASWVPTAEACLRWAGPRVPFPFEAAQLPALLTVEGGRSYCLAEPGRGPVGFGQHWVITEGAVHLGRVIVSPATRGQGHGRLLCQLLMAQAIQVNGARAVTLRVYRDNTTAQALYSSLGFVVVETESNDEALFMQAEADPLQGLRR